MVWSYSDRLETVQVGAFQDGSARFRSRNLSVNACAPLTIQAFTMRFAAAYLGRVERDEWMREEEVEMSGGLMPAYITYSPLQPHRPNYSSCERDPRAGV